MLVLSFSNLEEELQKIQTASKDQFTVPLFGCINESCAVSLFGCIDEICTVSIQGIVSKFMPCGSLDNILHGTNNRNSVSSLLRCLKLSCKVHD